MRLLASLGRLVLAQWFACVLSASVMLASTSVEAQLVPGTGQKIAQLGDDFEDPEWKYVQNWPKNSYENDKNRRFPTGGAANNRWFEGPKRGQPDYVVRVNTPPGGLLGSQGAMQMRSLWAGVPYRASYRMQQDDLIHKFSQGPIPFHRNPSVVVRVYLPEFEKWERRRGPTFALRASCEPSNPKRKSWKDRNEPDTYWPGMILDFRPGNEEEPDKAVIRVRARENGGDYERVAVTQTGWWTWGMSFTSDGRVHYYVKPGVDDLTPDDHIASHHPYSFRGRTLNTFFFCVCNGDDGKTWSTPWVVDDPCVYFLPNNYEARRR